MKDKLKDVSRYLKQKNIQSVNSVATKLINKPFNDAGQVTYYLNTSIGKHLKSDDWMKILNILNR